MKRRVHSHETESFKPLSNCTDHNTHPDLVTAFPSQRCAGAVRSHLQQIDFMGFTHSYLSCT